MHSSNLIFFYLFCHFQQWHGLLSSSFAAVLLLSSSTLVAIVLIIQSELEMETSAIHASASRLAAPRKSSLKKTSIKTNTTTTTMPSSESSQTVTEASTDQNHSPSNSIRKQQKPVMKSTNLSSTNRGVKSAICLSWLLPILVAMCIPMIHQIIGPRSIEWWLELTSPDFIIFAITESLLVFLFVLLFVTLLKHLIYLSRKYEKVNSMLKKRWVERSNWIFNFQHKKKAFNKLPSNQIISANGSFLAEYWWIFLFFLSSRIGLLNRIALLYVINFLSHTFYLIYLNTKDSVFCYLFSITSILLVSHFWLKLRKLKLLGQSKHFTRMLQGFSIIFYVLWVEQFNETFTFEIWLKSCPKLCRLLFWLLDFIARNFQKAYNCSR